MTQRKVSTVFTEAAVIGLLVIVVFYAVKFATTRVQTSVVSLSILLFLTGALSHILFEYLGLNEQWCKSVYK